VEYRSIPGRPGTFSALGLSFATGAGRREVSGALSSAGLFQRASEAGVTFFDAIWHSAPAEVVRLARASPMGASRFVIAVGVDPGAPDPGSSAAAPPGEWPTILPIARDPSRSDLQSPEFVRGMERSVVAFGAPVWGAAWRSAADAQLCGAAAIASGARLLALPASLLSFDAAVELGGPASDAGAGMVGLDPMAAGALDGSFLTGSPLERGPSSRPSTLGELTERLGPITQLGFLTEGRRRTLAQAAVRFVLDLPTFVSVSLEIRSPSTIVELAQIERVPRLSAGELERLSRLGARTG